MKKLVDLLSFVFLFIFIGNQAVAAVAYPILSLVPNPSTIHPPQNLSLDVNISGLQSGGINTLLGAFDITINFNPDVLTFISSGSNLGDALGDPNDPLQTAKGGDVPSVGNLRFYEVSLLETSSTDCTLCTGPYLQDLQSDSFRLATLNFFAPGTSSSTPFINILITNAILSDSNGNAINDFTVKNASVAVPEPSSLLLLMGGLAVFGFVRRRMCGANSIVWTVPRKTESPLIMRGHMWTRIYLGLMRALPANCTFVAAVWAVLVTGLPAAYGSERDLQFVISDAYAQAVTDAAGEVDQSVAMGMDKLFISFIKEHAGGSVATGYARVLTQLQRARSAGNFRLIYGLGTLDTRCVGETPYVYPYIDVSTSYDPRQYPAGDFYENWNNASSIAGQMTGQDGVDQPLNMPTRTALVGRDVPGNFLVAGAYWKFVPLEWCGGSSVYRFRFPLRLESDPSSLNPNDVVAVIEFVEEDQEDWPSYRILRTLATRPITVQEIRQGEWRNLDVFLDYNVITPPYHLVDVRIRWSGNVGLSIGEIGQDRWDQSNNRTMLESLDHGILSTGPGARNVFDYLTDLNAQIAATDPSLAKYLEGFSLIDEPQAQSNKAWNRVADAIRSHLGTLPGFEHLPILTTFATPAFAVAGQPYRFDKLASGDNYLAFNTPVFAWDDYLFSNGHSLTCPSTSPPMTEGDYQSDIDYRLSRWTTTAAHVRSRGIPSVNFLTIQSSDCRYLPVANAELAAQVYLTLALGIDRIAFWHVGSAINSAGNLTARGIYLRDLVTAVRQIKPTYDQLKFVETYSSPDLNGKLVSGLHDLNGKHANDLRIQVGQFTLNRDSYVLLVNRHTRTLSSGGRDDALDLEVTFHLEDSMPRKVVDTASNTVLGTVSRSQPSVRLHLDPGQGRLLGITIPADMMVIAHGPSGNLDFERSVLHYDGRAGAFIDYFGGACHAVDLAYGPDNRLYVLDAPSHGTPGACAAPYAVRRFNGLTGAFEDQDDEHANYIAYSGLLPQPGGFTFGPDDNLYISNWGPHGGVGNILRYQGPFGMAPGEFIDTFVPSSPSNGGLGEPTKLRFGPDGALYVTSQATKNLLRYQGPSGTKPGDFIDVFIPASPNLGVPSDFVFGPDGNLYIAGVDTGKVLRYAGPASASPGQYLGEFVHSVLSPIGITFGPEGDLFVSGSGGVFRYDRNTGSAKGLFASVATTGHGPIGPLIFSSSPLASVGLGDYNGDRCVDRNDLTLLLAAINRGDTNRVYDLNGDGLVNIADSRKLTLLFSNAQGAPCK